MMLKWLGQIRSKAFENAILTGYAAIVASAIAHHEPWADEAQAWQLARNLSLHDLFVTYLHYDVHPILWYVLLRILNLMGISYSGMHWICGAIGVAGTALFLFCSPFPKYLRALLPFTYFLLFQYAVVARGYVLIPLLFYLVALQWEKRIFSTAVLLGLLANVELHAAAISGGFATVYLIEQLRDGAAKVPARRNRLIIFALILAFFYAFALATAWPAHDQQIWGITAHSRSVFIIAVQSLLLGLCDPLVIAFAFWVLFVFYLDERRKLIYLLPPLFFACFATNYFTFWHAGLIVPLIVTIMWISWPASKGKRLPYEHACSVAFAVVCCVQIACGFNALNFDRHYAYSGDLAAAAFLKPYAESNTVIAVTYIGQPDDRSFSAVGILPYFNDHLYANWTVSYWLSSKGNRAEKDFETLLPSHPKIVVVETRDNSWDPIDLADPKIQSLVRSGYRFTNQFCGTMPYRLGLGMRICHLVFQYPNELQTASH